MDGQSLSEFILSIDYSRYLVPLHVVSVVAWFSGLFYIVRLFVYHVEAGEKSEIEQEILQNQFKIMQRRLWYGITWPAAIATIGLGIWIMFDRQLMAAGWLHVKMLFVIGLMMFHLLCGRIRRNLALGHTSFSAFQLRMLNEVPTLFLVAIVFIVYLKDFFSGLWAGIILTVLALFLISGVMMYRRLREKSRDSDDQ